MSLTKTNQFAGSDLHDSESGDDLPDGKSNGSKRRRVLRVLETTGPPPTRAGCENKEEKRPCTHVGCKHHLALKVSPRTGTIKTHLYPGRGGMKLEASHFEDEKFMDDFVGRILAMSETCALDVAARGGATLDVVKVHLGVTRERVRQIEVQALEKLEGEAQARQVYESFFK